MAVVGKGGWIKGEFLEPQGKWKGAERDCSQESGEDGIRETGRGIS